MSFEFQLAVQVVLQVLISFFSMRLLGFRVGRVFRVYADKKNNFWGQFIWILCGNFGVLNPENKNRLDKKSVSLFRFPLRSRQLWLASDSLGFLAAVVLNYFLFINLELGQKWVQILSRESMNLQDFHWIFYLSTNYLMGALIGFTFSFVARLLLPQRGVFVGFSLLAITSGVFSFGICWGIVLGDLAFSTFWELIKGLKDREVLWSQSLRVVLLTVLLIFTTDLQQEAQTWVFDSPVALQKVYQLLGLMGFYFCLDFLIQMSFFHFRHQLKGRLSS